jgi:NADH:ubiquinone oxidoreductase subunit B-like Fe-S oxidoreductase
MEFTSEDLPIVIEIPGCFRSTSELYADMLYIQKLAKEENENQRLKMQHIEKYFAVKEAYKKQVQEDRLDADLPGFKVIIN